MTLEEIFELWNDDAQIDSMELGQSALDIAKLHHKYYEIYSRERLLYKKLEAKMKVLKREKFEFYVDGPTQEQIEQGWQLPPKGKLLKAEVPMYLESDNDIIAMNLKIAYQQEKIDLLDSIIKTISNRGFHIKSAVEWEKFKVGA